MNLFNINFMKRIFTVLPLMLLFLCSNGQSYERTRFYVGGHLAGSFPWIVNQNNYGLPELKYKPNLGFSGGGVLGVSMTSQHQIQLELSYALHGQKYEEGICGDSKLMGKKVSLSYFQIPLMYRFGMKRAKDAIFYKNVTTFFMTAGVQVGFLLGENVEWTLDGEAITWEQLRSDVQSQAFGCVYPNVQHAPTTGGDWYQSLDFGVAGGFGVQRFINERVLISAEFRAYLGLLDINNDSPEQGATWRVPNNSGNYGSSRNFSAGLRLNASYLLGYVGN